MMKQGSTAAHTGLPTKRLILPGALALVAALALGCVSRLTAAETTWVYGVQLSATAHTSPPRIELSWVADELPAESYLVQRKAVNAAAWDEGVTLPGDATSFTDEKVELGARYEYKVAKYSTRITAYGYIAAGLQAPLVDDRGKVILVVDQSMVEPLGADLARFEQDLTGDGWTVVRREVSRGDSPWSVRDVIRTEYAAEPERVKSVILLGHIPIARSGNLNVDLHGARPLPADVFYGEMNGEWTDADGNGILDQNLLPSDVELAVGRIDFANLPGTYAASAYPSEVELLKRYLAKNHAYRQASTRPAQRALVGNAVGDGNGQAYAASAYRNFAALVGANNVVNADTRLDAPAADRWFSRLTRDDYAWAFGCGGGSDFTVSHLGTHGAYNDVWASDFLDSRPKAAFYLLFGSWFVDWSASDNILRTALASPELGLAAAWCGRPHLFLHHMGSGDTIGHGFRLSQNNAGTLYQNQVQRQLRGVHIALLGDPTLRQHIVAPPRSARTEATGPDVVVTWTASADTVSGYHVYRADGSRFVRVTDTPVQETRFVDRNRGSAGGTYMVRAIALQAGPSGSYVNASQGAFATRSEGVAAAPASEEMVWFDDALPPGATGYATSNDRWQWIETGPAPFSGKSAHISEIASGVHNRYFAGVTAPLQVHAGDKLFAYVYLDPYYTPREVMLTWSTGHWEHRAYWGENLIVEGTDDSPGRRYMGPLPEAGRWVRLEVPAHAVDLEGKEVTGMGFNLFDGRAAWDRAGKVSR